MMKIKTPIYRKTPFFEAFYKSVEDFGGLFNAHLHLDRALTLKVDQASYNPDVYVSLHEKHHRIGNIHAGPDYDRDNLNRRVRDCLDVMIACGTRRADSMVDVSDDRVGLSALETLAHIKQDYVGRIDVNLAAYTPFGFTDKEPQRWALLTEAAEMADFLGFLPEADDHDEYPDHIGFEENCRRGIALAKSTGKMLHVHLDQRNEPSERGTERLIEVLDAVGAAERVDDAPLIWGVHVISPTTYDEGRFRALVEGLRRNDVGVICCPTAALGMRQLRPFASPTDNSFPRVLDFIAAGVELRIASDNIADACSPSTTPDLADEVLALSAACRFYDPTILAKLACGAPLDEADRDVVRRHLGDNRREIDNTVAFLERIGGPA